MASAWPTARAIAGLELVAALPQCQRDPDFARTEYQETYAARLQALGVQRVLWTYEVEAERTVAALQTRLSLRVDPVVPNMREYLRDASDFGVIGAAYQRFRRLRLTERLRIALHNAPRAHKVLANDFATGLLVLVEMELARFGRFVPGHVFLTASVTDLTLALGRPELLAGFVRLVERTYGLTAGLATYNYGMLEDRLRAWGVRPSLVAAPFNPRGYLMNPSRDACEAALKTAAAEVLATHLDVDGHVSLEAAGTYLRGLGIHRGVVDPVV